MNMVCLQINQGKIIFPLWFVIMYKEGGYLSPATIRRSTWCCQYIIKEKFIYVVFLRHLCAVLVARQILTEETKVVP